MLNVKWIRPSLLEGAVFFMEDFPGEVTVAVTDREAVGEPSTKVTEAYLKKKKKKSFSKPQNILYWCPVCLFF